MLKDWEIVHEMDNEDGSPGCYGKEFDGQFFWVTQMIDCWVVETKRRVVSDEYSEIDVIKKLKTARGAARWAEKNYERYLYNRKEN